MAHSTVEIDDQTPLLPQTEKDEIEEGRKVDHFINIKETNGQDPSGSQTKKSVNQIFEDLDNVSTKWSTIFKVNVMLRESNAAAYTPKMVSIGPYHKKNPQLHPMKKYKLLYLKRFLRRKEGLDKESCISEMLELKEEVLKCYKDIEDLDTDEFCQMLLLDGCFVVDFIRECCGIYSEEDIIMNHYEDHCIFRDLMLLENQLPFFVLNKLHHMTMQDDELPLAILVSHFFSIKIHLPIKIPESFPKNEECNIKHLLHLVHILSCPNKPIDKLENKDDRTQCMVMPNATELSEAGVRFAKVSNSNSNKDNFTSLFDIKFKNGLMTIPGFQIQDSTETLLRNLIAYEQQSSEVHPTYFSDYATFMDNLIESAKDVNLLRQKGIIENFLGDDKEVADLFNKVGSGVNIYPDFYYKEEFKKAVEHHEKSWNKLRAHVMHNCFRSVCTGASTVAAIIGLILTAIQTIQAFRSPVKK